MHESCLLRFKEEKERAFLYGRKPSIFKQPEVTLFVPILNRTRHQVQQAKEFSKQP